MLDLQSEQDGNCGVAKVHLRSMDGLEVSLVNKASPLALSVHIFNGSTQRQDDRACVDNPS